MDNKKSDRRIKYTKMVLKESLLELMKTKDINKITVKGICQLADINRGTFYSHYKDPFDLLNNIESELMNEIKSALQTTSDATPTKVLRDLFLCIKKNQDLCTILFSEYGDEVFLKNIMEVAGDQYVNEWAQKLSENEKGLAQYLYSFTSSGGVGLIQKWVQSGMKESAEEMAEILEKMTYRGLQAFFNSG